MLTEQELLTKLGEKIKLTRSQSGISQEELAFISHVHRTYIGMVERGEKNITVGTLLRISNALGISFAEMTCDFSDRPEGRIEILKRLRGI